jgi:hypothetical protein
VLTSLDSADISAFAKESASFSPVTSAPRSSYEWPARCPSLKCSDVTLKIEKVVRKRRTILRLIGRIQAENLREVAKQLEGGGPRFFALLIVRTAAVCPPGKSLRSRVLIDGPGKIAPGSSPGAPKRSC